MSTVGKKPKYPLNLILTGRKIRFPTVLENLPVLSWVVRENLDRSMFH